MWQADFGDFSRPGHRLYLFVILDDVTGFIVGCDLVESLKTEVVIHTLRKAIARHGKPEALCTDRGSAFMTRELRRYLETEQIEHIALYCSDPQRSRIESLFGAVRRGLWDTKRLDTVPVAVRRLFKHSVGRDKAMRFRHGE